jgi:hypothetical protein
MPRDGELSHQKNNAVILSGGEAGARDLTSADVIDAVDEKCIRCTQCEDLIHSITGIHRRGPSNGLRHSQDDIPRPSPDARRARFMEVRQRMGTAASEKYVVILSGEAGARDLTSLDVIDAVDGKCIRCTQREDLIHCITGIHSRMVLRMACAILRMTSPDSLRLHRPHQPHEPPSALSAAKTVASLPGRSALSAACRSSRRRPTSIRCRSRARRYRLHGDRCP